MPRSIRLPGWRFWYRFHGLVAPRVPGNQANGRAVRHLADERGTNRGLVAMLHLVPYLIVRIAKAGESAKRRDILQRERGAVEYLGLRCTLPGWAVSTPLNPILACVPSQNGLLLVWPHRHKAYVSEIGNALPSSHVSEPPSLSTAIDWVDSGIFPETM